MAQDMTDRRKWARTDGETLVRFEGENFWIYSKATNVSPRGAFISTHYLLEPGTQVQLFLIDSLGNESTTVAKVVRTASENTVQGNVCVGMGLEFVEHDPTEVA